MIYLGPLGFYFDTNLGREGKKDTEFWESGAIAGIAGGSALCALILCAGICTICRTSGKTEVQVVDKDEVEVVEADKTEMDISTISPMAP